MTQRSTNASRNKGTTPEERIERAEKRAERIEQKVAELADVLERQQSGATRDEVQVIIGRLHEAVDAIEGAYAAVTDVLRTCRLEVIDPEGTVRAVIGEHDSTFGLTISDKHDGKQVFLNTDDDGPGLYLAGNGNIRATVSVSEGLDRRASISLMDGDAIHRGLAWSVTADGSVVISQPSALRSSPKDS